MTAPCCSVGARPDAGEIDAALRAGEGLRTIAKRFPLLAKSSLGVHRAQCLGLGVQKASSEVSSASEAAGANGRPESDIISEVLAKEAATNPSRGVQKVARARGGLKPSPTSGPGGVQTVQRGVQGPVQDLPEPAAAAPRTDDEHVQAIADKMADGDWVGRRSVREYANAHGLRRGQVKDYARAAALVCYADEEQIEQRRQPALGRWLKLYEDAMAGEPPDRKAAAAALAGYDRAAGIIQPKGPAVQVNVDLGEASRAMAAFFLAVAPDARLLFDEWLGALRGGDAQAKADPAAWVAAHGRQVVEALPAGGEEGGGG